MSQDLNNKNYKKRFKFYFKLDTVMLKLFNNFQECVNDMKSIY